MMVFVMCHSSLIKVEATDTWKLKWSFSFLSPASFCFGFFPKAVIQCNTPENRRLSRHIFFHVSLFDFAPNWTEIC